ncbi:MAG: hypothetical protein KAS87_05150 [Candidatus Omnitrophica bacterium]|nr:hypothetical protein [Candidatus Omnitrophota bacterium]
MYYKEITQRPLKAKEIKKPNSIRLRKSYIPAADHPWRNFKFGSQIGCYNHQEKEKELVLVKT